MAAVDPDILAPDTQRDIDALAPRELAVALLTFENGTTVGRVVAAARDGLDKHFRGLSALLVNVDAGSTDETLARVQEAGLPAVSLGHAAPASERAAVPFHGVPGRNHALRTACAVAHRARATPCSSSRPTSPRCPTTGSSASRVRSSMDREMSFSPPTPDAATMGP